MARAINESRELDQALRHAVLDTRRGLHPRRVLDGLVKRGLPEDVARRLVVGATEAVAEDRIAAGKRKIVVGALVAAVGIGLTVWTFADASRGGRIVILFYGAIFAGVAQVAAAFTQIRRWRSRLEGTRDPERLSAVGRTRR